MVVSVSDFFFISCYLLVMKSAICSFGVLFSFLLQVLFAFSIRCPIGGLEFTLVWTFMVLL